MLFQDSILPSLSASLYYFWHFPNQFFMWSHKSQCQWQPPCGIYSVLPLVPWLHWFFSAACGAPGMRRHRCWWQCPSGKALLDQCSYWSQLPVLRVSELGLAQNRIWENVLSLFLWHILLPRPQTSFAYSWSLPQIIMKTVYGFQSSDSSNLVIKFLRWVKNIWICHLTFTYHLSYCSFPWLNSLQLNCFHSYVPGF